MFLQIKEKFTRSKRLRISQRVDPPCQVSARNIEIHSARHVVSHQQQMKAAKTQLIFRRLTEVIQNCGVPYHRRPAACPYIPSRKNRS